MNPLRRVSCVARDVHLVARQPSIICVVVMYWMMTRELSQQTQVDREDAWALFASRILGVNPDTALAVAEDRRQAR